METYDLHVAAKWDIDIATIRERVSDFTNIIGFGNFYYRICKDDEFGTFKIRLWPSEGTSGKFIKLTLRYRDLYVESIAGHRFERYPSTLLDNRRNGASLRSAIYEICDGSDDFETRALVVYCVAESLRSQHIAQDVRWSIAHHCGTVIRGHTGYFSSSLLYEVARKWGQASDAIFSSLSDRAKEIVLKPRSSHSPEEAAFHEMVNESHIGQHVEATRRISLLKRPSVKI